MLHLQLPEEVFAQSLPRFIREIADRSAFAVPAAVLGTLRCSRLPEIFGFQRFDFRGGIRAGLRNIGEILHFQHDVLFQRFLYFRIQIEYRQLQESDRLL